MAICFHPHAKERMRERGATEDEVIPQLNKVSKFRQNLAVVVFDAILCSIGNGVANIIETNR